MPSDSEAANVGNEWTRSLQMLWPKPRKAPGVTSTLYRWHSTMMLLTFHFVVYLLAVLPSVVFAIDSIGPRAILPIVNRKIAPDGFFRQ
jgi:hypothetical protein